MYFALMCSALSRMLFLALHVTSQGSFPKPLTPAQEQDAFRRMREGDAGARAELIEHNLRLVAHIVKKYYAASGEQDDLISIGTIGLIKAISTYDCGKNIKFATYASKCIENEILMCFRQKRRTARDLSINDPIDTDRDGNALTLLDLMSDEEDLVALMELDDKAQKLRGFLTEALDAREREILTLRYGLNGRPPLTQREVAKRLGISRSYVSRIEKKAIETLRERFGA